MKEIKMWQVLLSWVAVGLIGILLGAGFSDYDINVTMDNNTRMAIESFNETLAQLEILSAYKFNLTECIFVGENQEYWCIND